MSMIQEILFNMVKLKAGNEINKVNYNKSKSLRAELKKTMNGEMKVILLVYVYRGKTIDACIYK